MAKNSRLVITTSDTHDPAIVPFAPDTMNPQELAHPTDTSFSKSIRAYSSSKLCNLLTARSFADHDNIKERGIQVIAYNPGLTGGTSLSGNTSPIMRAVMFPLMRLVSLFRPAFYMGTAERAGEALAELSLGKVKPPAGRVYASLVKQKLTFPDPSSLAQNNDARDLLWRESAKMVGLPE